MKQSKSVLITLDSCGELGDKIIDRLGCHIKHIDVTLSKFGNNEINIFPRKSVREKNVFIIASGSNYRGSINDNVVEMLGIIRACRDASARHITLICCYFPYCRSDKKDQGRTPIMAKLMCDLLKSAGVSRLITFDLHSAQIQGFFEGPFDNLYAGDYLINKILNQTYDYKEYIVVSPDVGGLKRLKDFSNKLKCNYTFLEKSRDHNKISHIDKHQICRSVDLKNKVVFIVDDIGDTFGTLNSAAQILKEGGAPIVIAVITHGIFSGKAFQYLQQDYIDKIYVTNTLPQIDNTLKSSKIEVVDISELCCKAILCCVNAKSISKLFK